MNKDISIMIIDDNEPMRLLIKAILKREGYKHFVEAEDGESAFSLVKNQKIDLIISDWNMLGKEINKIDHLVRDAAGEFTNMISGDARKRIQSKGLIVNAGIPSIISGNGHEIKHILDGELPQIKCYPRSV